MMSVEIRMSRRLLWPIDLKFPRPKCWPSSPLRHRRGKCDIEGWFCIYVYELGEAF